MNLEHRLRLLSCVCYKYPPVPLDRHRRESSHIALFPAALHFQNGHDPAPLVQFQTGHPAVDRPAIGVDEFHPVPDGRRPFHWFVSSFPLSLSNSALYFSSARSIATSLFFVNFFRILHIFFHMV